MRGETLNHQDKQNLPEQFHEDWSEKFAEDGLGPCECVGRPGSLNGADGKVQVEETNGSLSRFKEVTSLKFEEELSTMVTLAWAEGS